MVSVITPTCMWCGRSGSVKISDAEYRAWTSDSRPLVQEALSETDAALREQLLTGTHPKCWDEMLDQMMGDDPTDEEDR